MTKTLILILFPLCLLICFERVNGQNKPGRNINKAVTQTENWHEIFIYDDSFRVTVPHDLVKSKPDADSTKYSFTINDLEYSVIVRNMDKILFTEYSKETIFDGLDNAIIQFSNAKITNQEKSSIRKTTFEFVDPANKKFQTLKRYLILREQKTINKMYLLQATISQPIKAGLRNEKSYLKLFEKAERFLKSFSFGGDNNDEELEPPLVSPKPISGE